MPEPEVSVPATAPESTPPALTVDATPTETALTRTEITALIAAETARVEAKVKQDLDAAYKAARRSESKGDTANARIVKLETALEEVATRGMDEGSVRLWKAERAAERATETSAQVTQQQEYAEAQRAFAEKSTSYLATEGVDPKDERLTASFARYVAEAKTYADWDNALIRAVADVHKAKAKQMTDDVKTQVEKAREEERAKLRNEQRASDGKVDRGTPAATGKVDWSSMSDEEFKAQDALRTEERLRRQRQLR